MPCSVLEFKTQKKGEVQLGEQEKLWAERIIKKFEEHTLQRSGE
jgi:hypothetical protein